MWWPYSVMLNFAFEKQWSHSATPTLCVCVCVCMCACACMLYMLMHMHVACMWSACMCQCMCTYIKARESKSDVPTKTEKYTRLSFWPPLHLSVTRTTMTTSAATLPECANSRLQPVTPYAPASKTSPQRWSSWNAARAPSATCMPRSSRRPPSSWTQPGPS